MPNTGTDTGMMFGRDDLRVLEASAGAVREQLNAQAAAASDTPMNPFKAILGGAEAAAQIKKQADAQDKMAKSNAVQASWYDLITSEKYMTSKNLDRVNMIEDFMKAYAEDTDTELMSQKLAAGQYTKAYQGFIQERDNAVLSQVYADHKRWQEENPNKGPQDYVEWVRSIYPTIDRGSIRSAMQVGLFDEYAGLIKMANSQGTIDGILKEMEEAMKPYQNPYFLKSNNSTVKSELRTLTSQFGSILSTQRKTIAANAKAELEGRKTQIDAATGANDLSQTIGKSPSQNPEWRAIGNEAFYGKPDQMARWFAEADKKYKDKYEKTIFAETHNPATPQSEQPSKIQEPAYKHRIAVDGVQAFDKGDVAGFTNIIKNNPQYISELKTQFGQYFANLTDPQQLEKFMSTLNQVRATPGGKQAMNALIGMDKLAEFDVLDYLVKFRTDGDIAKARSQLYDALSKPLPQDYKSGKLAGEIKDMLNNSDYNKLPGYMRAKINNIAMFYSRILDAQGVKDLLPTLVDHYNSMITTFSDPIDGNEFSLSVEYGTPSFLLEGNDLSKQAFAHYIKGDYPDAVAGVYIGSTRDKNGKVIDRVSVYDNSGMLLGVVNTSDYNTTEYMQAKKNLPSEQVKSIIANNVDVGTGKTLAITSTSGQLLRKLGAYILRGTRLFDLTMSDERADKELRDTLIDANNKIGAVAIKLYPEREEEIRKSIEESNKDAEAPMDWLYNYIKSGTRTGPIKPTIKNPAYMYKGGR